MSMKSLLLCLLVLGFVVACTPENSSGSANTVTLETGVEVKRSQCIQAGGSRSLQVTSEGANQQISIADYFPCSSENSSIYLTTVKDNKATLVMKSKGSASGCECMQNVKVKLSGRLEKGNVLYVVNDSEALGHAAIQ
jgi:hypothetical protein